MNMTTFKICSLKALNLKTTLAAGESPRPPLCDGLTPAYRHSEATPERIA